MPKRNNNNRKLTMASSIIAALPSTIKFLKGMWSKLGFSFDRKKFMSNFQIQGRGAKKARNRKRVAYRNRRGRNGRKLLQVYNMQISKTPQQGYTLEYQTQMIAGRKIRNDGDPLITMGMQYQYYAIGKGVNISDAVATDTITPGTWTSVYLTDITVPLARTNVLFYPQSAEVTTELTKIQNEWQKYRVTGVTIEFDPQYTHGNFQNLQPFYVKVGASSVYSLTDLTNVSPIELQPGKKQVFTIPYPAEDKDDVVSGESQWTSFTAYPSSTQKAIATELAPLRLDMTFPKFTMNGDPDTVYTHATIPMGDSIEVLFHIKVKIHIMAAVPKPVSQRVEAMRLRDFINKHDPMYYNLMLNRMYAEDPDYYKFSKDFKYVEARDPQELCNIVRAPPLLKDLNHNVLIADYSHKMSNIRKEVIYKLRNENNILNKSKKNLNCGNDHSFSEDYSSYDSDGSNLTI